MYRFLRDKTRRLGIEPRLAGSKPAVLPLDDLRVLSRKITDNYVH